MDVAPVEPRLYAAVVGGTSGSTAAKTPTQDSGTSNGSSQDEFERS